ncbi:hypothetical protein BJV78DRAFT_1215543 [Lactifluus subvellereus]|nr:hypothetical protein BJV78DRAFT_1215543 [Lactifluus subvellereus]
MTSGSLCLSLSCTIGAVSKIVDVSEKITCAKPSHGAVRNEVITWLALGTGPWGGVHSIFSTQCHIHHSQQDANCN